MTAPLTPPPEKNARPATHRNLGIDSDRLWASIHETAQIGGTPKGGINRQALTTTDREVRDWFKAACEACGCTVTVDGLGSMFARRPGRHPTLPPIAIGSHLDTQPTGGRYDGVLGVLAGLEILRALDDSGHITNAPIEVINWTNEEGARFAPAMLTSGVFAGVFTQDYAESRQDRTGTSFGTALDGIGYRGTAKAHPISAHFELHIEQGPILEAEGATIGIVTGVQSIRWYEITVTGADSHAGTTPMHLRHDAMLAAARMIAAMADIAASHGPDAKATVGLVECRPNRRNAVPGEVFFSLDLRHPEDHVVASMDAQAQTIITRLAEAGGVQATISMTWESPAVHFNPSCIEAVERATLAAGLPHRRIVSGAGHDSAYIARIAPTTMVFIPCAGGLSHNEAESATQTDIAAGADVLLRAVLDLDSQFEETQA